MEGYKIRKVFDRDARWSGPTNYFLGFQDQGLLKNLLEMIQPTVWHSRLWSFQGRDTKLERFLAKNQLYSNEITKF